MITKSDDINALIYTMAKNDASKIDLKRAINYARDVYELEHSYKLNHISDLEVKYLGRVQK